jgi:hypothetical protein
MRTQLVRWQSNEAAANSIKCHFVLFRFDPDKHHVPEWFSLLAQAMISFTSDLVSLISSFQPACPDFMRSAIRETKFV